VEKDEHLRAACFLALDVLHAQFGEELPYSGGLDRGFSFAGRRVPFLNYQKGIYRAGVQRGPAAFSIQTSYKSPYDDEATELGFIYAYRAGPHDQPDNRALRAAYTDQVPLVYFVGTRSWWYRPVYPCFVTGDDPSTGHVVVTPGKMAGPMDDLEPVLPIATIERRYVVREVRTRLHQARFRGLVLPAYQERCAICRLKEVRLLDAAHILQDSDPRGTPLIANGLSLCSIHHRAFDQDLVGVSPDYTVHVSHQLLDDDDGPMLDVLKAFHGMGIELPKRSAWRPDRELLASRFERFRGQTA
jgi:putative restriction endonuclease